ncbi:MAG: hypothetical protein HUT38_04425 [Candidatus Paceibacter sp.]|nr:hypothetical protein [Candidatus Paceibacter sp.]
MSNIETARKKFEVAKKRVEDCQKAIFELQNRYDSLTESIPHLRRAIEALEKRETEAFDNYVLGQITEKELKTVQADCQKIQAKEIEANKMIEALGRGIKKTESDLVKLNTECNTAKRAIWESISNELRESIPVTVFEQISKLVVCGAQCGQTRQWILDSLFPNLPSERFQEIRRELLEQYKFED